MENFEFYAPTRFILERDAEKRVGTEAKRYANKVLLVDYGGVQEYERELHETVVKSFTDAGLEVYTLEGVQPNPRLSTVKKGIEQCRQNGIECIVAVGGGSVIDTAKAIALGTKYDGDVWDFFVQKAVPEDALPVGVIMTLPGTGSEGSTGSVIVNDELGKSADVMSDILRPRFVLMNPELTQSLPQMQSAYGIIDMFTHVMERYFSTSQDVVLTDHMCEAVMMAIVENGRRFLENPTDYNMRAEFMWTAIVAHNGLLATGRNQDWSTHMMAAPISATYNVPHGATLSILYPRWMEYVYRSNIPRFAQFAVRVFQVRQDYDHPERTALEGIRRLREFFTSLGGQKTLSELGIKDDKDFTAMAKEAVRFGSIGGIQPLQESDVIAIYKESL